jgi:anti-anti-sigma factor
MAHFTSRIEHGDGPEAPATIVYLSGELDLAVAPILTQDLEELGGHITFDCSELEYIDSSGLAIFARVARNGGATLRNANDLVFRILEITGLDDLHANR